MVTASAIAWPSSVPLTRMLTSANGSVAVYGVGFVKFIVAFRVMLRGVVAAISRSSMRGLNEA